MNKRDAETYIDTKIKMAKSELRDAKAWAKHDPPTALFCIKHCLHHLAKALREGGRLRNNVDGVRNSKKEVG